MRLKHKDYTKKELWQLSSLSDLMLICLLALLLGALLNYIVISSNECRMPVYTEYDINTTKHFSFKNKSEVKFFWFADTIPIQFTYYSIGDLCLLFGGGLFIFAIILRIKLGSKIKKRLKKNDRR